MTKPIALVTDSTCDIPAEWLRQYEIAVVPLTIIFGEQTFLDRLEMSAEQFYQRLEVERAHPSTSQPSPAAFLRAYQQAAAAGAGQVLAITIGSAMSGTYQSARQAAQESPIPVQVVDGKNTSMGVGWQVVAAARAREAGGELAEMLAAAEQARRGMVFFVSLDTIEFLGRGGRIMEAARFLDSILNIKPLVYVRPDSGRVEAAFPARSRHSAIDGLYKEFFRNIPPGRRLHLYVGHTNAPEEAEELAERVRREAAPHEMFVGIACPALGVHAGPRAIALCGYVEP